MALSTPTVVALLVVYMVVCGMAIYYCGIADPGTSNLAHLFQVRLTDKIWSILGNIMSDKQMDSLQTLMDLGFVAVYFFVVLGCWTVVFFYIYPWIDRSDAVGNYHKYIGYFVFLACFGSWRYVNTSSPGMITAQSFKRYDHFPYDNLMFLPNQRCQTTKLLRIPRSKFDRLKYNQNVPRYDHYCGWVYNTIGEENYRWFLLFLLIHVVMCVYGSAVCVLLFYGEIMDKQLLAITFFDRASGEHVRSSRFIVMQYLFSQNTMEFAVLTVMFVMGIALGGFLGYHIYLTSFNITTNEDGKWSDITKWYMKQRRRYQEAVKNGLVTKVGGSDGSGSSSESTTTRPRAKDGDVSCTGGSSGLVEKEPSSSRGVQQYFDPGPVPKNIYDRGFIENWKEVLFPMSRRKDALLLGGYSRQVPKSDETDQQTKAPSIASSSSQAKTD